MSAKRVWWIATSLILAGAVGGAAATGVAIQRSYADITHAEPFQLPVAADPVSPLQPQLADAPALAARLDAQAAARTSALANFGGDVIDVASGKSVWSRDAERALVPASSTKVLTASAAVWELGADDRLTTEIVRGANPGEVVIKASGDVWLTLAQLDRVAEELKAASASGEALHAVFIDTSVWTGAPQAQEWDPENVDAGYVAPMEPAMIFGGRLGGTEGDLPRTHTPALDVANALARRLGVETVGFAPAPAGAEVLATMTSPTLGERAQDMMKHSDNVMAEAIGRELAIARGKEPSFAGATEATLEILAEHGIDTSHLFIADNSGLSTLNRIPAATLAGLVARAASTDAAHANDLRPLLGLLPVAGGDGTLYTRYAGMDGRGNVRAKTGTLTGTSALVGTAQGQAGTLYAFAFLVNDGDILAARQAQDELASALSDY